MVTPETLTDAYKRAGIPVTYRALNPDTLEKTGAVSTLWTPCLEHAKAWRDGEQIERGLLIAGSQGSGKSTALWMLARAAIKAEVSQQTDLPNKAIPTVKIFCRKFQLWVEDELKPQPGEHNWNQGKCRREMLDASAIFLDDLTLDPAKDVYRPVKEFLTILFDELSDNIESPIPLYLTSNNSYTELENLLGAQVLDRLCGKKHGLCEIIKCDWKSFR